MKMNIKRTLRGLICCLSVVAGCAGYDSTEQATASREEAQRLVSTIHASGDGDYASELGPVDRVTEDEFGRIVDERLSSPAAPGGGAETQVQCWRWDAECYGCCHGNVCCTYCRGIPGCY